jgi:CheY-like chemotaxis protein
MHGGAVEARSDGLGQGSEFVVRLPALVETPAEPVADEGEQTGPPPPARKRILVVDDNVDAAVLLARILELESHEVRIAHDGHAGLEAAKAFQPDVVLLDISLPGMDGLEVARRLRVEMASRQPLLVAISGFGQDEDFRRTDEAGFDQLLVKPIEPGQLIGLIASASPATATA